MASGTNKSNSARQIFCAMQTDTQPLDLSYKITSEFYKGYEIKVYPKLQPHLEPSCIIGLDGDGLAHRKGLKLAKEYIDTLTPEKATAKLLKVRRKKANNEPEPKRSSGIRIPRRKMANQVRDCRDCQGSGATAAGAICKVCKGTGEIKQ